jgi:hypothetical protein
VGRARTVPDDLITLDETSAILHITPQALYSMRSRAARGETEPIMRSYKVGRKLLFSKSEVLAWVASREDTDRVRQPRRRKAPANPVSDSGQRRRASGTA